MGNTNCVANGGTPFRADITIANNTKYELTLATEEICGRECAHGGWQISQGKIVETQDPPIFIKPYK